jgi:hypothetical protein
MNVAKALFSKLILNAKMWLWLGEVLVYCFWVSCGVYSVYSVLVYKYDLYDLVIIENVCLFCE